MIRGNRKTPAGTMHLEKFLATESDFRICASCGAKVHKADLHKNRYAQYICRECRSSGVRAVGQKNLRYVMVKMPVIALGAIAGLVLVLLLVALALLGDSLHSYSKGDLLDDLKGVVRSLNQMAH